MYKIRSKSNRNIFRVLSFFFFLTFILVLTNVSYATSQEVENVQLFTNEELQKIEDYMNENMNVFHEENLGIPQVGVVKLDNGDEVKITVVNEIDTSVPPKVSSRKTTSVLPGQDLIVSVTKDRTGFLGGSMTTRAAYSTVSGSNNIRMKGRYVEVDGVPPDGYDIKKQEGYFTSKGPSDVLYVKSYQSYTMVGITTKSTLDITLTGGYKEVTTTYKWKQG